MKRLFLALFALFLGFAVCTPAFAENFYIKNYDVTINVTENKKAEVHEDLAVFFTQKSHGIYRDIPVKHGSKVGRVWASGKYDANWQEGPFGVQQTNVRIKIGDPDKYVFGDKKYKIEYDYLIGDKKDEFYFNIIGNDWDTDIQKARFRVVMPAPVEDEKVGISIGSKGTKGFTDRAKYYVHDNVITGETTEPLRPHEGITIRVEVPRGYFNVERTWIDNLLEYIEYGAILIILLLTGFAYITWFVYGKDEHVTPVVNFNPPENMNSADAELFYRGMATDKSLVSLIFYLANKGYLKITQTESFLGTDFIIEKLKEYDGKNKIENAFFKTLLYKNKVTKDELANSVTFSNKCQKIVAEINKDRKKVFEIQSISGGLKFKMGMLMMGILFLTLLCMFNFNIISVLSCSFPLLFVVIAITVLTCVGPEQFIILWASLVGGMPLIMIFAMSGFNFSPSVITGLVCLIITGICFYQLPKRSRYGNQVFGQLLGFKKFIEVAEKPRLMAMLNENPSYFYDVLPFAYVLDVSDKWIKQFEGIVQNPDWYTGSAISIHSFNAFSTSMISSGCSSSSHSSSSGGGGHSGGGHGGGGGGSW